MALPILDVAFTVASFAAEPTLSTALAVFLVPRPILEATLGSVSNWLLLANYTMYELIVLHLTTIYISTWYLQLSKTTEYQIYNNKYHVPLDTIRAKSATYLLINQSYQNLNT